MSAPPFFTEKDVPSIRRLIEVLKNQEKVELKKLSSKQRKELCKWRRKIRKDS